MVVGGGVMSGGKDHRVLLHFTITVLTFKSEKSEVQKS